MNRSGKSAGVMLSAALIGACAIAPGHAQSGPGIPALLKLHPKGAYALNGPADCRNDASALCGEKLQAPAPSPVSAPVPASAPDHGSLRVQGDAAALRIDVRQRTIKDVLSALTKTFDVQCRSSVALDEPLSGTYSGSLAHVVARLLDGYNYAIEEQDAKLDVTIVGRVGERAVPGPGLIPLRERHASARRD